MKKRKSKVISYQKFHNMLLYNHDKLNGIYRQMYNTTTAQNTKMTDQIQLLTEKLEFFISHIKQEQGKTKRGEYFTLKDEEYKGKPCTSSYIL